MTDGRVQLIAATLDLLDAEEVSGEELARLLNVHCPPSWPPMFNGPETRQWARDSLYEQPGARGWYSWYIVVDLHQGPTLAGIGGYKGPPDGEGKVEIGYSVVPELQRRGIASAAVELLCRRAFDAGIHFVVADTLPELVPSQHVLKRAGFDRLEVIEDRDEGKIWRYRRANALGHNEV